MTPSDLLEGLQRPWKHGEHLDGRGLILNDPLVLDGLTIRGFDLSEAVLKGGLVLNYVYSLGVNTLFLPCQDNFTHSCLIESATATDPLK